MFFEVGKFSGCIVDFLYKLEKVLFGPDVDGFRSLDYHKTWHNKYSHSFNAIHQQGKNYVEGIFSWCNGNVGYMYVCMYVYSDFTRPFAMY